LFENFTAAVEVDPTIPAPDSAPSAPAAPLLASVTGGDTAPVVDNTTPDIVLATAKDVVEVAPKPESQTYEIQEGDMLSKIVADHYGLTEWADIQRAYETVARNNGIEDPDLIYTGNSLILFDDPTVDLFPEGQTASSDLKVSFNESAEGLVAANAPEAPVVRPQPRPADLLAPAA
jgi:LysM repeat protein